MFLSWFGGTFVTLKYRKNLFDNLTEWLCVRGGKGNEREGERGCMYNLKSGSLVMFLVKLWRSRRSYHMSPRPLRDWLGLLGIARRTIVFAVGVC